MKSILIKSKKDKQFKKEIANLLKEFSKPVFMGDSDAEMSLPGICETLGLSVDSVQETGENTFKIGNLENINNDFEIVICTNVEPAKKEETKAPETTEAPKAPKAKAKAKAKK